MTDSSELLDGTMSSKEQTGSGIVNLTDRLLLRRFSRDLNFAKNSPSRSESDVMHAVDGHCMRIDELPVRASAERVDGHLAEGLSLSDRILMKKYTDTASDRTRRDGSTVKEESNREGADGSIVQSMATSREGADGSIVQSMVRTGVCSVVGRSVVPDSDTSTATAPLSGASAFPTCTISPHTATYVSHRQIHSTTRAVARTNPTYHATPRPPCSPGAPVEHSAEVGVRRTTSLAWEEGGERADGWSVAEAVKSEPMDQNAIA